MKVSPYGSRALRCDVGDLATAHRLTAALRLAAIPEVEDVVPSWTSVLVVVAPGGRLDALADAVQRLPLGSVDIRPAHHEVPVRYDGPDLGRVAGHCGLPVDEVIERHAAAGYTVAFVGFLPGFGYLSGLPPVLATPRLPTPRPRIPAGSVGIAEDVTGVYPADSPGGWNIIGHTTTVLFDVASSAPARFKPGDRVRFRIVG